MNLTGNFAVFSAAAVLAISGCASLAPLSPPEVPESLRPPAGEAAYLALGQATDNVKRNRDVIRQHHERLNRGDVQAAVLDYAEDTKNQGRPVGREGLRLVLEDIYTTFPDWRMEIAEMVAEGDSVVVRCTVSGTHRGVGRRSVNGGMLVAVAPTQKRFEVQHIHWYELRDGKIVEHRANRDDVGMMRQLGLLPPVVVPPNPR